MEMGARDPARLTHFPDEIPPFNPLFGFDQNLIQMGVIRSEAASMVQDDQPSITRPDVRENNFTVLGSHHPCTPAGGQIKAFMKSHFVGDGMDPVPETIGKTTGGGFDKALLGLQGNQREPPDILPGEVIPTRQVKDVPGGGSRE